MATAESETISPKEALLDYHRQPGHRDEPLFPDSSQHSYSPTSSTVGTQPAVGAASHGHQRQSSSPEFIRRLQQQQQQQQYPSPPASVGSNAFGSWLQRRFSDIPLATLGLGLGADTNPTPVSTQYMPSSSLVFSSPTLPVQNQQRRFLGMEPLSTAAVGPVRRQERQRSPTPEFRPILASMESSISEATPAELDSSQLNSYLQPISQVSSITDYSITGSSGSGDSSAATITLEDIHTGLAAYMADTAGSDDESFSTASPTTSTSSIGGSGGKPAGSLANAGTYTCTYSGCPKRFDSPKKLQKHKREQHRPAAGASAAATDSASTTGDESGVGTASARTRTGVSDPGHAEAGAAGAAGAAGMGNHHLDSNQLGPHRCDRVNPTTGKPCDTKFSRPYDLNRHEDTIHNAQKQKSRCPLCSEIKMFSRGDALTRHMRVVHPEVAQVGKRGRKKMT